eukprot:m.143129 g.143129  ORF g.143129 m.143129 type:complete len:365 (+) comp30292_c0_seq1:370-1464(+)
MQLYKFALHLRFVRHVTSSSIRSRGLTAVVPSQLRRTLKPQQLFLQVPFYRSQSWHHPVVVHRGIGGVRCVSSDTPKRPQLHALTQNDVAYCLELVRKQDHSNYLCTLLLDSSIRDAAFTIRAFNVEVAQIRDSTREKLTGKMRYQFWRDGIDMAFAGTPSKHPVTVNLAHMLQKHNLPQGFFHEMINARVNDHDNTGFKSLEEIEEYADQTISCVLMMLLQVAGVRSPDTDLAACHVGRAIGLANVLRGAPHLFQRREIRLPKDLLTQHSVTQRMLESNKTSSELEEVVFAIASAANSHIEAARRMTSLPTLANQVLLPAIACARYLEQLQKENFDIYSQNLHRRDAWLPLTLAKHKYISKTF